MSNKLKIAVVTGGSSAEKEISLASASVVMTNLDSNQFETYLVDITETPWTVSSDGRTIGAIDLNTFQCVGQEAPIHFDCVFMSIHGTPAEDGKLQGYFDTLGIKYTCSGVLASSITFDKDVCKQLLRHIPLKQAKSALLSREKELGSYKSELDDLSIPLFVKPNKNGSSYGVSKVNDRKDLNTAIQKSFEFDDEVLVEEFIDGRELACGVFTRKNEIITLPVTEIISENEFFDYEAKYQGKSKEITPANITKDQDQRCAAFTETIYKHLKLKGACRVDYFLSGDELYLLEVNTIPGMSAESLLPQQAVAAGFTLKEFFGTLILEALASNVGNNKV